jgi:hypothetical protein
MCHAVFNHERVSVGSVLFPFFNFPKFTLPRPYDPPCNHIHTHHQLIFGLTKCFELKLYPDGKKDSAQFNLGTLVL